MKFKLNLFLMLLMTSACLSQNSIETLEIICDENNLDFAQIKNLQSCLVHSFPSPLHESVTIALVKKLPWAWDGHRYSYQDFYCSIYGCGLSADNKNIPYIPMGLERFFPYLIALSITKSHLKKITSKNLQHYYQLQYLDLSENELQSLEPFLFEKNLHLKYLHLNSNKIAIVETNSLNGLINLEYFDFSYNYCYNHNLHNQHDIKQLIQDIKDLCSIVQSQNNLNWEILQMKNAQRDQNNSIYETKALSHNMGIQINDLSNSCSHTQINLRDINRTLNNLKLEQEQYSKSNFNVSEENSTENEKCLNSSVTSNRNNDAKIENLEETIRILMISHIVFILIFIITIIMQITWCMHQKHLHAPQSTKDLKINEIKKEFKTDSQPPEVEHNQCYEVVNSNSYVHDTTDDIYEPITNDEEFYAEYNHDENYSTQNYAENSDIYSSVNN